MIFNLFFIDSFWYCSCFSNSSHDCILFKIASNVGQLPKVAKPSKKYTDYKKLLNPSNTDEDQKREDKYDYVQEKIQY